MKSAFVTGAHGFIGRHLCRELAARGIPVVSHTREDGDICTPGLLRAAIARAQPTWIFHLAANTGQSPHPAQTWQTNQAGTQMVLQAAQAVGAHAVVLAGSYAEYGDNPVPFREEMAPHPLTAYGASKAAATQAALAAAQAGLPATVVRLPVVYGPGQSAHSFVGQACTAVFNHQSFAMTAGVQTRDFLFVADAVGALLVAAERITDCQGQVLNAGTGTALSLLQALNLIEQAAGCNHLARVGELPYRPGEPMNYWGDCTKIRQQLGWTAKTRFAQGIRQTLDQLRCDRTTTPNITKRN